MAGTVPQGQPGGEGLRRRAPGYSSSLSLASNRRKNWDGLSCVPGCETSDSSNKTACFFFAGFMPAGLLAGLAAAAAPALAEVFSATGLAATAALAEGAGLLAATLGAAAALLALLVSAGLLTAAGSAALLAAVLLAVAADGLGSGLLVATALGLLAVATPTGLAAEVAAGVAGLAVAATAFDTATGAAAAGVAAGAGAAALVALAGVAAVVTTGVAPVGLLTTGVAPVGLLTTGAGLAAGLVSTLGLAGLIRPAGSTAAALLLPGRRSPAPLAGLAAVAAGLPATEAAAGVTAGAAGSAEMILCCVEGRDSVPPVETEVTIDEVWGTAGSEMILLSCDGRLSGEATGLSGRAGVSGVTTAARAAARGESTGSGAGSGAGGTGAVAAVLRPRSLGGLGLAALLGAAGLAPLPPPRTAGAAREVTGSGRSSIGEVSTSNSGRSAARISAPRERGDGCGSGAGRASMSMIGAARPRPDERAPGSSRRGSIARSGKSLVWSSLIELLGGSAERQPDVAGGGAAAVEGAAPLCSAVKIGARSLSRNCKSPCRSLTNDSASG